MVSSEVGTVRVGKSNHCLNTCQVKKICSYFENNRVQLKKTTLTVTVTVTMHTAAACARTVYSYSGVMCFQ